MVVLKLVVCVVDLAKKKEEQKRPKEEAKTNERANERAAQSNECCLH